jgi:hypothetical protein
MAKRLAAMRAAAEKRRLESEPPEYPAALPDLRREIIVRDHDSGTVEYHFKLYRTGRVDCYRLECDGKVIAGRVGWAKVLETIRKGFVRVRSTQ